MVHGKGSFTHSAFSSLIPINKSKKFAAWLSPIIVLKTTQPETPLSLLWFTKMVLRFITFSCLLDLQLKGSGQPIKESQCLGKGGLSLVRSHCDVWSSNHTGGGMCSFCQAPSADKVWGQKQQELWHTQAERLKKNNSLWLWFGARAACGCKNICYKMVIGYMHRFGPADARCLCCWSWKLVKMKRDLGLTATLKLSLCLQGYYTPG